VVWLGVVDRGRRAARVGVMVRDAEDRLLTHVRTEPGRSADGMSRARSKPAG
jgi:hypothetical protein